MAEREIKHAQFAYSVETERADPTDADKKVKRLSRRLALRGQIVDIPRDEDIQRGEEHGAFVTEEERAAEEEAEEQTEEEDEESESSPGSGQSHDELVAWIRDDKPSAAKVIAAAGNDAKKAEALLDAEYEASGGQPRKSVVTALEKIEDQ